MGLCPCVCCQDLKYLVISFLYSFLFFTQRLVPSKSYIPSDLDRIYIVPLNLSQSLFAPLHFNKLYTETNYKAIFFSPLNIK